MSDNGLVWEEPTLKGDSKFQAGFWENIVRQLEARPNEWAVVYEQADGQSEGSARNRRVMIGSAAKRLGVPYEVTTRVRSGRVKVYARVVSE